MLALESPAVTDGIAAWKAWKNKLSLMPSRDQLDRTVIAERKRADRVIKLLEEYPRGLDIKSPNFMNVVRELTAL